MARYFFNGTMTLSRLRTATLSVIMDGTVVSAAVDGGYLVLNGSRTEPLTAKSPAAQPTLLSATLAVAEDFSESSLTSTLGLVAKAFQLYLHPRRMLKFD